MKDISYLIPKLSDFYLSDLIERFVCETIYSTVIKKPDGLKAAIKGDPHR